MSNNVRSDLANSIRDCIDQYGDGAKLNFYSGLQPISAQNPVKESNVLLGSATFSYPSAEDAMDGVLSFNEILEEPSAQNSGDVTWARVTMANGESVFDVDVTGPRGGGTLEINSTRIVEGGPIRVSSFTIVIPAG